MRNTICFFLFFIGIILSVEIGLRILGIKPYRNLKLKVVSKPTNAITIDSLYGYGLNTGEFSIKVNEGLSFNATHIDNYRSLSAVNIEGKRDEKLDFFGCSFTYGFGVDDSSTFPSIVQKYNDSLQIGNYGVSGFGTVQVHDLIKQKYNSENPDIVIYCYANFHLERTVLSKIWQENTYSIVNQNYDLKNAPYKFWRFPYATLQDDTVVFDYLKISSFQHIAKYSPRRYSGLANVIGSGITNIKEKRTQHTAEKVTISLIENINSFINSKNGRFIVAFLTQKKNDPLYNYCKENNIETLDMAVPLWENIDYTNLPYDPHPSPLSHKLYADSIMNYLRSNN